MIVANTQGPSNLATTMRAVEANPLHSLMLDQAMAAVIATDPLGTIIFWNRHAETLFGWTREETLGQSISSVTVGPQDAEVAAGIMRQLAAGQSWDGDFPVRCKDGTSRWLRVSDTPIFDDDGTLVAIVGVSLDVSPQKAVEVALERQAFHDPLTELPNRANFARQLDAALASASLTGTRLAVILFDLDRFKAINDLLGHAKGDLVLIAAAERLTTELPAEISVARFGGDEFAALVAVGDIDDAQTIAERFREALASPIAHEGWEFHLRASIGIAISEPGATTPNQLLRAADMALYQAKAEGGDSIRRASDDAHPDRWFALEADLRRALIVGGEFVPHYQPIIDLATGCPLAMEALLRWQHPAFGLLMPAVFLPLAAEIGLIGELGGWVFEQACLQARAWHERYGAAAPVIDVNLALAQLDAPGVAAQFRQTLARTGAPADRLRLEVTERAVIENLRTSDPVIHELHALGLRLAVEDFGQGASSLAVLCDLPIDLLKIDQQLIGNIDGNPRVRAVVSGLITMAHNLGSVVTFEEIETAAQRDTAAMLGFDAGQGFHLAEPMPATAATAWLDERIR